MSEHRRCYDCSQIYDIMFMRSSDDGVWSCIYCIKEHEIAEEGAHNPFGA